METDILLIGIDGGASKVSVHQIIYINNTFELGKLSSTKKYQDYPSFQTSFKPVDLNTQLAQIKSNSIVITQQESEQSQAYYNAFTDAIADITMSLKLDKILIGVGMPGIKSEDGRGIVAMANGPRMPNFTSELGNRLLKIGINLIKPIVKIGSDADYCGIGEEFAENGTIRNFENAYYLGGGTGTADALKLLGQLISFDYCRDWNAKTWEFKSKDGKSMEAYCSANGIQSIYSDISNIQQTELIDNNIYLEQILKLANGGDSHAIKTWELVVDNLALLLFERITTVYSGYQKILEFIDPRHQELQKKHKFRRALFDRIIFGQRLGHLLKSKEAQTIIITPLLSKLTELILADDSLDEKAKSHYIKKNNFDSNIITFSNLNEAPALGAGIDAWHCYVNN